MPSSITLGDTASVSLSYVNKGKNPISNLEARLSGTNLGAGGYQYLGNLNAGTEGSVDFDLSPEAGGAVSGTITLSYEDASGEPRTITKDFSTTAEEMTFDPGMVDPGMEDMQPEQTGLPAWAMVLIVVCGRRGGRGHRGGGQTHQEEESHGAGRLEAEDSDEDL